MLLLLIVNQIFGPRIVLTQHVEVRAKDVGGIRRIPNVDSDVSSVVMAVLHIPD